MDRLLKEINELDTLLQTSHRNTTKELKEVKDKIKKEGNSIELKTKAAVLEQELRDTERHLRELNGEESTKNLINREEEFS